MQKEKWMAKFLAQALFACCVLSIGGSAARAQGVPKYRVDPSWPKMPLPNKWIIQGVPDLVVDKEDHIWVVSRPRNVMPDEEGAATSPPRTDCCIVAPAILEFDTEGNLVKGWGRPDYTPGWPAFGNPHPAGGAEHGILVDRQGNVWLSGASRGDSVQKFTSDGKFLWDFGHRGLRPPVSEKLGPLKENNEDTGTFPAGVLFFDVDEDAHEMYIVDAKRVLVYDVDTGAFKRGWGGHGIPLSEIDNDPTPPYDWKSGPPPDQRQFAPALHCVHISVDGLVYVCERGNDRVQVFTKQGRFVTSFFVHPSTPARGQECGGPGSTAYGTCGTIYNLTFSHDPMQKYILIADGANDRIWIQDRKTGELAGSTGDKGRMAGQFHRIDGVAMDSKGNIYTGEIDGKRIQKFILTNGDGKSRPHPHE